MLKWFHNLKVAQKLALISIFFMIPDSIMLYLFITSINENIHFAKLEQVGNEYQRPLEKLLELVPQHRMLARHATTGQGPEFTKIQAQIDGVFDTLDAVDARIGKELDFTPEGLAKRNRQGCDFASVRAEWEKLKSGLNTLDPQVCDQKHLQLVSDIRTMIAHAGDMSNLILDPELDSYYLVDSTLMALPQTQDRLTQVMIHGEAVLQSQGAAADKGRTQLAIDLTLLKEDDLERIASSTQTALTNGNPLYGPNPGFHARVPVLLKQYTDAAEHFDALTAQIQTGDVANLSARQYLDAGEATRGASFRLWEVSDEELNKILQNRIDYYTYRRTRSLGVAASALAMAILLVTFITKSISGPLKKQATELKVANDELSVARSRLEDRVEKSSAELQRTQDKYRSIFENSVMGIFQTNPQGQCLSANMALAQIYGFATPDELMSSLTDIERQLYVDPNRRSEFVQEMERHDSVTDFESEIYRKDGSIHWINENARTVRDDQGQVLYYEGTINDSTQKKRAEQEEACAKEASELARVAAEEARAAAEAASTAKSDFLASMSHEIRTPLNGVIGMVDLLSNTSLTVQQMRYAKVIKSSSDGLLTLINQILDFSKIEAGKLELDAQSFDLHFAVEEVVAVLAQRASGKGLELVCKIDQSVPCAVRGDGDRIRQVLMNLINNAIKFTAKGEVVVRVSPADVQPLEPGKFCLKVSVSDTGIGIPPERLDRLFKSFSQVDASITRQFGGTGLGLAISKQLVELMGGQVGVESEKGKGSTFWFTVTVEQQEATRQITYSLKGHRVLVVDDNLTQCQLLQEELSSWELDAAYVTSAAAAIAEMQSAADQHKPFSIAIIDLNMPGMDGLTLARVLRACPALQNVPLILMSGVDAQVEAEGSGFVRFLTKPIRQSHLFDALMKALITPPTSEITQAETAAPSTAPSRSVATESARILLAEDMEVNQFVVTETLARFGYRCDIANNGREAVAAVTGKQYDLVLMDCMMPEMSGFEAAAAIRTLEKEKGVTGTRLPIIALTANAVKGDRERCLAAGMDEYLTKPLNPEKLIATIQAYTAKKVEENPAAATTVGESVDSAQSAIDSSINYQELLARCSGDHAMLLRLVQKFQDKSQEMWKQLLEGYSARDIATTTRLAHSMKGTAANLSASRVAELAEKLEDLGRSGDLENAESIVGQLGAALEECNAAFKQLSNAGMKIGT